MSDRIAVFNRGRIEQVGAPAEVYERPATAFVAGLRRHLQPARRARRPRRSSGTPGTFTVRPEKIQLADPERRAAGGRRASRRPAASASVVYLGPDTRYHVALDAGGELVVTAAEPGDDLDRGARPAGARGPPRLETAAHAGRSPSA